MRMNNNESKTSITTPRGNTAFLDIVTDNDGTHVEVSSGGISVENRSSLPSDVSLVDKTVVEYDDLRTNINHLNPIDITEEDDDDKEDDG